MEQHPNKEAQAVLVALPDILSLTIIVIYALLENSLNLLTLPHVTSALLELLLLKEAQAVSLAHLVALPQITLAHSALLEHTLH